jgi:electron transfer flavoprotein beta subunit
MSSGISIVVLLSAGRHPVSGRARRAVADARALELALQLSPYCRGLHVGSPDDPALPTYLGMGLSEITVVPAEPGADLAPPILEVVQDWKPDLILTGTAAETGQSSGMLPYVLAKALGWPIVSSISSARPEIDGLRLSRLLSPNRQRELGVKFPLIASVGSAGPVPRMSALAKARRGTIRVCAVDAPVDALAATWSPVPSRFRPKRMRGGAVSVQTRSALLGLSPDEAAHKIKEFLSGIGMAPVGQPSKDKL